MNRLGRRAVVLGGSIAGLITARVLSDYFDHVVILERDVVEDRPLLHRSVPQGHHLHALLQGGQEVLESLFPDFGEQLRALGATRVTVGRDIVWYLPDGKAYSPTGSLRVLLPPAALMARRMAGARSARRLIAWSRISARDGRRDLRDAKVLHRPGAVVIPLEAAARA